MRALLCRVQGVCVPVAMTLEWVGEEGWVRCPCHPTAPLCPPLQPTKL